MRRASRCSEIVASSLARIDQPIGRFDSSIANRISISSSPSCGNPPSTACLSASSRSRSISLRRASMPFDTDAARSHASSGDCGDHDQDWKPSDCTGTRSATSSAVRVAPAIRSTRRRFATSASAPLMSPLARFSACCPSTAIAHATNPRGCCGGSSGSSCACASAEVFAVSVGFASAAGVLARTRASASNLAPRLASSDTSAVADPRQRSISASVGAAVPRGAQRGSKAMKGSELAYSSDLSSASDDSGAGTPSTADAGSSTISAPEPPAPRAFAAKDAWANESPSTCRMSSVFRVAAASFAGGRSAPLISTGPSTIRAFRSGVAASRLATTMATGSPFCSRVQRPSASMNQH